MNRFCPALLTLSIALALSACQSTPEAQLPAPEDVTAAVTAPTPAPEPIEYGSFTTEQLNRALLNELAGQRGYLPEAAQDYYALALETRDLAVIRRASQFAAAAGDTETMIAVGRLWLEIEPASEEAHLVLAFQLLEAGMLEESIEHMGQIFRSSRRAPSILRPNSAACCWRSSSYCTHVFQNMKPCTTLSCNCLSKATSTRKPWRS